MTNPEQSSPDDRITLDAIESALTDEVVVRQFAGVTLALVTAGIAFGLVPVLYGGFSDPNILNQPSRFAATTQQHQNGVSRNIYDFGPYLAPLLAAAVAFIAGSRREGPWRKVLPFAAAGAFVGCLLFVLVSTGIGHTQLAVTEGSWGFEEAIPPYDMVGVLLNGALVGITGAVGALGGALVGGIME
ncbi:hypothetical protein [Haloarchaeobius sp. HME9146]|uniref:hypothetical protein n=1 Tax=Haloarchaeobius sp. HME9146 TaxID=2978732 RepID=UPI0021C07191|nr:hypothetical protein [Haloarchaeobius sp. HME9146]MCT9095775.1 hypothetical protein [Haloarchaeobius sp. HME9146]